MVIFLPELATTVLETEARRATALEETLAPTNEVCILRGAGSGREGSRLDLETRTWPDAGSRRVSAATDQELSTYALERSGSGAHAGSRDADYGFIPSRASHGRRQGPRGGDGKTATGKNRIFPPW